MQIYLTGTKPIFEEIRDSMRIYIDRGVLKPGERVPSVRELAISLSVNPNTVMRAYQVLTDEGLLIAIPKKGLYVAEKKKAVDSRESKLRNVLTNLINEGYTHEEIKNTLNAIKEEKDD
mgnify:CR=1 FL=1